MGKFILGKSLSENLRISLNIIENYIDCCQISLINSDGVTYTRENRISVGTYTVTVVARDGYQLDDIKLNGETFIQNTQLIIDWENSNPVFEITSTRLTGFKASVNGLGELDYKKIEFNIDPNFNFNFEEVTIHSDVTNDDNVFIKIPTMYKKIDNIEESQITAFTISTKKDSDDYLPYPCFVKADGTIMPYILIGKYLSKEDRASSISTIGTLTPANFRVYANNLGSGYQAYDWKIDRLLIDLILLHNRSMKIKGTDFFNINGLNNKQLIDGIGTYSSYYVYCTNEDYYVSSPTTSTSYYNTLNYNNVSGSGYITDLGYDENQYFLNLASTIQSVPYNTVYYLSYCTSSTSTQSIHRQLFTNGGLYYQYSYSWTSNTYIRLCYRPLDETI